MGIEDRSIKSDEIPICNGDLISESRALAVSINSPGVSLRASRNHTDHIAIAATSVWEAGPC